VEPAPLPRDRSIDVNDAVARLLELFTSWNDLHSIPAWVTTLGGQRQLAHL
jgi:hypothetical protein